MSLSSLKRMKRDLLEISKSIKGNKFILKALDGLFLIDVSKATIEDGKVTPVKEAPEGMDIIIIADFIDDIVVCGSGDAPVIIYGEKDLMD